MKKVLVLGDVMLDATAQLRVQCFSPEVDHVPVFRYHHTTYNPGGAANVAVGVRALGTQTLLFGLTSRDDTDAKLRDQLNHRDVPFVFDHWSGGCTTLKTRYCTLDGMVYRVDCEDRGQLPSDYWHTNSRLHARLGYELHVSGKEEKPVVVLVNYDKGFFFGEYATTRIMDLIRTLNDPPPVLVDPGRDGNWDQFAGPTTLFKANVRQCMMYYATARIRSANLISPLDRPDQFHPNTQVTESAVRNIGYKVRHNLLAMGTEFKYVVVTCGASGMALISSQTDEVTVAQESPVEVRDVCGAGDTAMAALAADVATSGDYEYNSVKVAVRFAEAAARTAVQIRGVAAINRAMIHDYRPA